MANGYTFIRFRKFNYLSKVRETVFHVEETKKPQRNICEFHKRHCISPSILLLDIDRVSFIVKADENNITETTKSKTL